MFKRHLVFVPGKKRGKTEKPSREQLSPLNLQGLHSTPRSSETKNNLYKSRLRLESTC